MTEQGKRIGDSQVTISQVMLPTDANAYGNVHGGVIMKLVDDAGAIVATRHSRSIVVTVAVDSMTFLSPIYVGNLVTLTAALGYVGRTSMEVEVLVEAEDPLTGDRTHTNTAYLVYVALDDDGQAREVPPLVAESEQESQRIARGRERQKARLSRRQKGI
ncbi:MAG TPA: acyl-CoA thioesterase [Anaerolineae bacterium]|nr:acyl-CoA thioesterase [Anaerolineae bacterium]